MPTEILERIRDEFHQGFIYLSIDKTELAKEKIENGINIFNGSIIPQSNDDVIFHI